VTWKDLVWGMLFWSLCTGILRLAFGDIILGELFVLVLGSVVLLLVLSMRHGLSSWLRLRFFGQMLALFTAFGIASLLVGNLLSSSTFLAVTLLLAPAQALFFVTAKTLRQASSWKGSDNP